MPGLKIILIGLGVCVLGGVITLVSVLVSGGAFTLLAGGAIVLGALQMLIGLLQMLFSLPGLLRRKAERDYANGTPVEVCHSGEPGDGENACRIYPDRMVTKADAAAYPGIRHRIGQDACAAILNPPPWWHALAFWRQR